MIAIRIILIEHLLELRIQKSFEPSNVGRDRNLYWISQRNYPTAIFPQLRTFLTYALKPVQKFQKSFSCLRLSEIILKWYS